MKNSKKSLNTKKIARKDLKTIKGGDEHISSILAVSTALYDEFSNSDDD